MILRKNEVLETLPREVQGTATSTCASSHPEPAVHVGKHLTIKTTMFKHTHAPNKKQKPRFPYLSS